MTDNSVVIPPSNCPYCNHFFDRATRTTGKFAPEPGDFSICIECGNWLVFTDTLTHRKLTAEETTETTSNPDLVEVKQAWERMDRGD